MTNIDTPGIDLLTAIDRDTFKEIRTKFHEEVKKSKKGERLEAFTDKLKKIRAFVEQGNESDWKRSYVCGVFFLSNSLGINIRSLCSLLGRCKSSVNGSLQQLGFVAQPNGLDIQSELFSRVPSSSRESKDLKKWTIRYCSTPKNPLQKEKVSLITETPFIIQLPPKRPVMPIVYIPEKVKYPCPIKCRYKYYDIIHSKADFQFEAL